MCKYVLPKHLNNADFHLVRQTHTPNVCMNWIAGYIEPKTNQYYTLQSSILSKIHNGVQSTQQIGMSGAALFDQIWWIHMWI